MWRVTIKGLMAKKLRLVLTSIAVVLGVAFMSGTFVLTDTLGSVFDKLFTEVTKGVDADVRSKRELDASQQAGGGGRNPVPDSLVEVVEEARGVKVAHGTVQGFATVVDADGDTGSERQQPDARVLVAAAPIRRGQSHHEGTQARRGRRRRVRRPDREQFRLQAR